MTDHWGKTRNKHRNQKTSEIVEYQLIYPLYEFYISVCKSKIYMYVNIYIYICVYIYMYMCNYIYINIYIYIHDSEMHCMWDHYLYIHLSGIQLYMRRSYPLICLVTAQQGGRLGAVHLSFGTLAEPHRCLGHWCDVERRHHILIDIHIWYYI